MNPKIIALIVEAFDEINAKNEKYKFVLHSVEEVKIEKPAKKTISAHDARVLTLLAGNDTEVLESIKRRHSIDSLEDLAAEYYQSVEDEVLRIKELKKNNS